MNKKKIIVIFVIALIPASMLLIFSYLISANTEYSYEMSDLQNMLGAENTAKYLWRDAKPENTVEYWYSAQTFELLDATLEARPAPYGLGRRKIGGALKSFQKETGVFYEYYENQNYTDKVLHLFVDKDTEGSIKVTMNWE